MEMSTAASLLRRLVDSLNSTMSISENYSRQPYDYHYHINNNDDLHHLQRHNDSPSIANLSSVGNWTGTGDGGGGVGDETEVTSWPTYLSIYVSVLNLVVFFTGTTGNALVIAVVVLVPDMRTPMNWYLVNLSVADLLVLLVCQPVALVEFYARERWFLGAGLCKLMPFLEHAVLHASILIILAITVERYYAICQPLKKMAMCSRPLPLRVLPVVWAMAFLTSVPFVVMTSLNQTVFVDGTPCEVCATSVHEKWHFAYIIGMSVTFFALPLLLLICLYFRIIRSLQTTSPALREGQVKDMAAASMHRTRKQLIKMLVGVVVFFFLSQLPVRSVILWQIFTPDAEIQSLGPENYYNLMWICRLLMYANSAGNPIIYSLLSSKFMLAFKRLLRGRRHDRLDRTLTNSRQTSFSRQSLSRVQHGSLSASKFDSAALNDLKRESVHLALRRIRTTPPSFSSWKTGSPSASPLIRNVVVKNKSRTSVL